MNLGLTLVPTCHEGCCTVERMSEELGSSMQAQRTKHLQRNPASKLFKPAEDHQKESCYECSGHGGAFCGWLADCLSEAGWAYCSFVLLATHINRDPP